MINKNHNKLDALNMDLSAFDYEDIDIIEKATEELMENHAVRLDEGFKFRLKKFTLLNSYSNVRIIHAFEIDHRMLDYRIAISWVGNEPQAWGIATLKKDFGHVLITKETIVEKIMDWIQAMDLDFPEDKTFSKKVFVVAKDRMKAAFAIDLKMRQAILEIKQTDFLIEIIKNKLIIGNRKIVTAESMMGFIDFLNKIV